MLRYLGRRVRADIAPDLVQEVYARALCSRQVDHLDNPAAFIRRITRNLLIDRARRRAIHPAIMVDFDDQHDLVEPAEQTWAIEAADLLRIYEQTVAALPDKTRRVFLLHRQEQLTYQQIAEASAISILTVKYHMTRALAACRAAIAANCAGAPTPHPARAGARHGRH
ncbi:MAG: hypothetical protein BGN95_07905 [Sphingomonas sp. 66-10]|nr:MAG: hypothetical protein BGN95_07905 [Sphingomonas sp. 66-10]